MEKLKEGIKEFVDAGVSKGHLLGVVKDVRKKIIKDKKKGGKQDA